MSFELPDWYILKDPGDITIEVDRWYKFAEKRLNRFLTQDLWIINRPSWITEDEWYKTKVEEIGGHFLLRLAVAKDARLTSWLKEVEGDLFEFRFVSSSDFDEKVSVLKDLYGENNVKTIDSLNQEFNFDFYDKFQLADTPTKPSRYERSKFGSTVKDLDKRVAIRFQKISPIIAAKKTLLYQGWAIVRLADIRLVVKREFEKQLISIVEKSKEIIERSSDLEETIKPIKDKITDIARSARVAGDFSRLGIEEGEAIFTKPESYPPCILELVRVLQSEGHLSHAENWQVGTFLKRAGMKINDQYKFWYENSVDNVGMSYEEFVQRIGYQIRHIYGIEGGGIDYSPPSCKTCINAYYCYWAHKKLEDIVEDIKIRFKDKSESVVDKAIDDISRSIINQRFQSACARYFTLYTGWNVRGRRINHMLNYSRQAYKRFFGKKTDEISENETENLGEENNDEGTKT